MPQYKLDFDGTWKMAAEKKEVGKRDMALIDLANVMNTWSVASSHSYDSW
jgi:hypothetical protein